MSAGIRCFLIEATDRARVYLRRYGGNGCPGNGGEYHNAMVLVGESPAEEASGAPRPGFYAGDPRWPGACSCGRLFAQSDEWQVFHQTIYRSTDDGAETTLRDAPAGAIWRETWLEDYAQWCGPDGRSYVVRCPGGRDWQIDGRASNCTLPDDDAHRCWCRHGVAPNLTVDKTPEPGHSTCRAGAGSIQAGSWHGFLRNGYLVT